MKAKKDNKKKFTIVLITGFIVFSMVISIFAIVLDNQTSGIPDYNDQSFIVTDYGYKTKIAGKYQEFYFYPTELERIPMETAVSSLLKESSAVAFVFNPEDNITENLPYIDIIRYDLVQQMDTQVFFGITQESDRYLLPIVGCENASIEFPFVIINSSANTGLYISPENPNCIIMNGKLRELLAAKDRLVYTYYGIMS